MNWLSLDVADKECWRSLSEGFHWKWNYMLDNNLYNTDVKKFTRRYVMKT